MIFKACAIGLIAAFTAFLLRELGVRWIGAFGAVCGAVILSLASDSLSALSTEIKELAAISQIGDAASDVLKIIGVGYIFGICSDICTDAGEGNIASALILAGRLEILGIALPYFKKIMEFGISLIK